MNDDLEPTSAGTPTPPGNDWWNRLFMRLVNVVGLILIVREAVLSRATPGGGPSWPILLVGLALISGAFGIELLLRGRK